MYFLVRKEWGPHGTPLSAIQLFTFIDHHRTTAIRGRVVLRHTFSRLYFPDKFPQAVWPDKSKPYHWDIKKHLNNKSKSVTNKSKKKIPDTSKKRSLRNKKMSPKNQNISQGNPKKLPPPSKCGRQWRQPVGLVIICVRQCVNVLLPSFILSMYCLMRLVSFILYFVNVLLVSCARVNILWGWRILLDITLSSCQISRSRSRFLS